jgi:hypothetical protein
MTMLVELTTAELAFLEKYGSSASNVYDGRGQSKERRKDAAKQGGFDLILAAGCTNGGHRLKTRAGHCAQCDTSKLARQTRYNSPGFVYIAGSASMNLLKIGITDDVLQRTETLAYERGYGGADDWEKLFHIRVGQKGKLEHDALTLLSAHRVSRLYLKNGKQQAATELLQAPFERVFGAVITALGAQPLEDKYLSKRWEAYAEARP